MALLIHIVFLANAVLGIAESALSFRITPIVVNGELLEDEVRASALLGHPLANAIIVGTYLLTLAVGGGRDLPAVLRPICFLVNAAGMAAFGGRAATAFLIAALVILALLKWLRLPAVATFDTRGVLAGLIVVPLVALLAVGLNELGFFDAFLSRVQDDDGSADTRIVMFELFRHQNWHDLLFMPDQGVLATWARLYGTDYGIESFVISYMLTYGIVATMLFLPALAAFCIAVVRAVRPGASGVFMYFFAVALTSLSLSAKSPVFTIVTLIVMVLLRDDHGADEPADDERRLGNRFEQAAAIDAIALAGARADEIVAEPFAGLADPADPARRIANDERVSRHLLGHDRARADEGIFADIVAADDRGIGADRGAAADPRGCGTRPCAKHARAD